MSDCSTLKLTVKDSGLGFLLDRLGQDCAPLQHLRELTKNGIEALTRPGLEGEIFWDIDEVVYDTTRLSKLCIIDTGCGMSKEELVEYINQLSSTGGIQSMAENLGMGAKITTATKNPAGVIYQSWKDGKGHMIHLWRDPVTSVYGLKPISEDPRSKYVAEISDELKPAQIKNHGTKVVLWGTGDDDDTMKPKVEGVPATKWVGFYLNSRFFKIPEKVTIRCREGWQHITTRDGAYFKYREVIGMYRHLEKNKVSSGQVALDGATAQWWILDKERINTSEIPRNGHVASLYQDELYDFKTGRSGNSLLQQFGIIFSMQDVVLYIEPQATTALTTDTARTTLKVEGQPLPWAEWAQEFREKMPQALQDIQNDEHHKCSSEDRKKALADRLSKILGLYRLKSYRKAETGTFRMDPTLTGTPEDEEDIIPPPPGPTKKPRPPQDHILKKTKVGNVFSHFIKQTGAPAEEVETASIYPEILWIEDPQEHDLVGYAATYLPATNQIKMNKQFSGFISLVDHFAKDYGDNDVIRETCTNAIHGWYELAIIDTFMGIRSLQKSSKWSDEETFRALSQEALTAVCMQRYHQANAIKRELGSKMGAVRE
jgi:hypothetical protein